MKTPRTIIGLCMLCALAFSAFAAQSASAATNGTTAFTCVDGLVKHAGGTHSDGDCENLEAGDRYEHVGIAENLDTTLKITPKSPQVFKATVGGTAITRSRPPNWKPLLAPAQT